MEECGASANPEISDHGVFINIDEALQQLGEFKIGGRDNLAQIVTTAVQAAVKAALPAIMQAVRDACMESMKEVINPYLLRTQFKQDELQQEMKRENLRLSGLPENEEETEDVLIQKVCGVAREVGVELQLADFSSCHRLGKPRSDGRPRQAIVRFLTRRKRDALYQARFNLKGKEAYKGLFINEDLTSMRYAVLSRAKEAPHVTRVSTKFGNIICKLQTGEQKVLRNPDDLFEVGIDNVDYSHFRLQVIT